jgi:hypothetical protein
MARYVGLDAHSKNCVYIEDESGAVVGQGAVSTTSEGLRSLKRSPPSPEQMTPARLLGAKPVRLYGACSPQRDLGQSPDPE